MRTAKMPTIREIKELLLEARVRSGKKGMTLAEIADDSALFDFDDSGRESLEFDSLDGLEVTAMLEEIYDVVMPFDIEFERISTPQAIREYISDLIKEQHNQ